MVFYFKSVLVDKVTGEIIGYEVESENNESVASITLEKAWYLSLPFLPLKSITRSPYQNRAA